MPDPRILVIGGNGTVGRLIVEDLVRSLPDADVSIASRAPAPREDLPGLKLIAFDIEDEASLRSACRGQDLIIMAAGPFGRLGPKVQRACLAEGVDCLDINDSDRAAMETLGLEGEARRAGARLVTGLGLTPGLSTWMLRRQAERDAAAPRDYMVRLFMGARHGGGAASPEVLLSGFRRRIPLFRDGRTQELPTPWRDTAATYLFAGQRRPLDLLPFPSPEAITLPFKGSAERLGIRALDHRYHVQFLPRAFARFLAWSGLLRVGALRTHLARMMHRSGLRLSRRRDASETTTMVVAPADQPAAGLMLHGPIPPAYLTASFVVSVALSFLRTRQTILPGVHPCEALQLDDREIEAALLQRGVIPLPSTPEPQDHRSFFGHSSPSTGHASGLRHFGKCWYSLAFVPPEIERRQQECLKRSRLWRSLRERLSGLRMGLALRRGMAAQRRNLKRLKPVAEDITTLSVRRKVCRDFALFAAGYGEARKVLGPSARDLYAEMFLDRGAMEMAWFWPSAQVFAAAEAPGTMLRDYLVAYFEEAERQGVLQHQVTQGTGDVLTLSIGRCTYARLLATLGCPELGDLVREMERAAISELAQACNLSLTWTAGASPGTGIFCLQQRSTRAAE